MKPWIITYTGRKFWPLDPKSRDISIRDIAHALSNTCRFTGHCRKFYSVAEHSVLVSQNVPARYAMWGLLHDASEAYLADLSAPLKQLFPQFVAAEKKLMEAVCGYFVLPYEEPAEVKLADTQCLVKEAEVLMHSNWSHLAPPLPAFIHCLSPREAEDAFIHRYRELGGVE